MATKGTHTTHGVGTNGGRVTTGNGIGVANN